MTYTPFTNTFPLVQFMYPLRDEFTTLMFHCHIIYCLTLGVMLDIKDFKIDIIKMRILNQICLILYQ